MKKVSIITVNFNNQDGLERTYQSIRPLLEQEQYEVEWIVIDGGSQDGSRQFLEDHNSEISYWCSEKDSGIYNAMNKGIGHANGEYYLFLNSGDCLITTNIQSFLIELKNEDLIYGDVVLTSIDDERKVYTQPDSLRIDYFFLNSLCHQSIFFKDALFSMYKYDESYKIAADLDFLIKKLFLEGCSYRHISLPICEYETFGRSASMYYSTTRPERLRAISQALEGGEYWYNSILLIKELDDSTLFGFFLRISSGTQGLKTIASRVLKWTLHFYDIFMRIKKYFKNYLS